MRKLFLAAAVLLAFPAASGAAQVGTTTVYTAATFNRAGSAQVYRFTASQTGGVNRLNVYLDGGNGATRVILGLYSGSSTRARTLLGSCAVTSPQGFAWNRCTFATTATVTSAQYYWLAVLGAGGMIGYRQGQVSGGPTTWIKDVGSSLPATWSNSGALSYLGGYQGSVYADQTQGGCPDGQYEARYYTGQTLSGTAALDRCEATINNDWGTGSPPGVPADHFSARYDGRLTFDAADYRFTLGGDDGVRLYVDNQLVIDQWRDQAYTEYTNTRTMSAGTHDLRVDFYENAGLAAVKLTVAKQAVAPPAACADGLDNDGDGKIDYPADPGCASSIDNDETDSAADPPPSSCATPPCWDWVGNSFDGGIGGAYTHVVETAQDFAVSGDGYAVMGAPWIESAHDVRVITPDGRSIGPRPGNSAGRFRENGGGPRSVAITNTSVYAAQSGVRNVVKWDRATFVTYSCMGCTYQGQTFPVPGTGTLAGLAAGGGGRIFVGDTSGTVRALSDTNGAVLNTWSVPRVRRLDVDREGNVWALQQASGSTLARLSRWSPTGGSLGGFDVGGYPTDVGASQTTDEVLVPDNGPDQRIERYDYQGRPVGTFGESYLDGPTPGLIGPRRFAGPVGVDTAANGDIYTHESWAPGRGDHFWGDEQTNGAAFSRYQPDGTRLWYRYGTDGFPGEPSNDQARYYEGNVTYRRGQDGRYTPYAVNVDPFTGGDVRLTEPQLSFGSDVAAIAMEREFDNQRWLVQTKANTDWLRVWRFQGEIAHYVRQFPGGEGSIMAPNGDVYVVYGDAHVERYRYTGNSTWSSAQNLGGAPGFQTLRRIDVQGNSMYLSGWGPEAPYQSEFDSWKFSGKKIARYDFTDLATAAKISQPRWSTAVAWGTYPDRPVTIDTNGNHVAVAYLGGGSDGRGQGSVRLYDARTGVFQTQLLPPADYGEMYGWCDAKKSITYKNDMLSWEGIGEMKATLTYMP